MRRIADFLNRLMSTRFNYSLLMLMCILFLLVTSCEEIEDYTVEPVSDDVINKLLSEISESQEADSSMTALYFGHEIFKRGKGAPFTEKHIIMNHHFNCFTGNYVVKINNGDDKKTRVSSAEIKIDGEMIIGPSDFSKNVSFISRPIPSLTEESVLEVRLASAPGSFIDLWIEGDSISITPTFTSMQPILQNTVAPLLPDTSYNGIAGDWNPDTITTDEAGVFTYTFTPYEGQCAVTTTMDVVITNQGTFSDIDGNIYEFMKIGDQWWMTENLRTTYLNDSTSIPLVSDTTEWVELITPGYCWYGNDMETNSEYGAMYNYYSIETEKLCPDAWHVPTSEEWQILANYLGGRDVAGGKLKESGMVHWNGPNTGATNESEFNGLPGGFRSQIDGAFYWMNQGSEWWEIGESTNLNGISVNVLAYDTAALHVNYLPPNDTAKNRGVYVRCIKD